MSEKPSETTKNTSTKWTKIMSTGAVTMKPYKNSKLPAEGRGNVKICCQSKFPSTVGTTSASIPSDAYRCMLRVCYLCCICSIVEAELNKSSAISILVFSCPILARRFPHTKTTHESIMRSISLTQPPKKHPLTKPLGKLL